MILIASQVVMSSIERSFRNGVKVISVAIPITRVGTYNTYVHVLKTYSEEGNLRQETKKQSPATGVQTFPYSEDVYNEAGWGRCRCEKDGIRKYGHAKKSICLSVSILKVLNLGLTIINYYFKPKTANPAFRYCVY